MIQFKMFLLGCLVVSVITAVVNVLFRKNPRKADKVINYIMFLLLAVLLQLAIRATDWMPVEEKLSKDLKDYRETQRNVWGLK